jgi:hypothetical protein
MLAAALLLLAARGGADGLDSVYMTLGTAPALIEVNLTTGDRTFVDLDDFPRVIAVWPIGRASQRDVVLATFDAGQRRALKSWDPVTGALTGISGFVDPNTSDPAGSGRGIPSQLRMVVPAPPDAVLLVGPDDESQPGTLNHLVMRVDRATGNRTVVSSTEGAAPVGEGLPLGQPDDALLAPGGRSLWVLDRFEGLIDVNLATGNRTVILTGPDLGITPQEIELLPDGRIVGARRDTDLDAIFVTDPATRTTELLSGEFGGNSRGSGPLFQSVFTVAADNLGRVFVYDIGLAAILEVNPATGDRRIVSGGNPPVGTGPAFPTADDGIAVRLRGAFAPTGTQFVFY